jgi:membrane protein
MPSVLHNTAQGQLLYVHNWSNDLAFNPIISEASRGFGSNRNSPAQGQNVRQLRYVYLVVMEAFYTFLADDGWAIASHIALSTLMALFPFLIVLTSLAGFFGSKELADQAAQLLLQIWPQQVADALSSEIHDVLTTTRGDILTVGAVLAVYLPPTASRRCGSRSTAPIRWSSRGRGTGCGWNRSATRWSPRSRRSDGVPDRTRSADPGDRAPAHSVLRREQRESAVFRPLRHHDHGDDGGAVRAACLAALRKAEISADRSRHRLYDGGFPDLGHRVRPVLARFASNYVTMYAGLASVIIALVFLYFIAAIFVYGGELNAAIMKSQSQHDLSRHAAQSLKRAETQA